MKKISTLRPTPTALLSPTCDSSFKAMFTADTEDSNFALKDFVSTILGKNINEISLLPNEPVIDVLDENRMSFDVSAKFDDGERLDLEMQACLQSYDYPSRAEIQVARLLSTGNKRGDNWKSPNAYQISVLNFNFNKDDKSVLSWYTMKDEKGFELAGKLNVIFFNLMKINKLLGTPPEKLSKLEKWGLFLSYADNESCTNYINEIVKSEEGIMNAKSALNLVSQDDINWARQNSIYIGLRDYNAREGHLKDLENNIKIMKKDLKNEKRDLMNEKKDLMNEKKDLMNEKKDLMNEKKDLMNEKKDLMNEKKDLANKQSDFEKTKLTFAKKLLTLGFSLEEIARETDIPRDVIINL